MQSIVNTLDKWRSHKDTMLQKFRGIIMSPDSISDSELADLIAYLGEKSLRVVVVDINVEVSRSNGVITAPSVFSKTEPDGLINVLRTIPECIIFRNILSEKIITEVEHSALRGHDVICFTDFSMDKLKEFLNKSLKHCDADGFLLALPVLPIK